MSLKIYQQIQSELNEIKENHLIEINSLGQKNQQEQWNQIITIIGPENSPYEGIKFSVEIIFPSNYPQSSPKITFLTNIVHLNFNESGRICKHIIEESWTNKTTVKDVIQTYFNLLSNPIIDCSLVPELTRLYKKSKQQYLDFVAEITKKNSI